MDGYGAGPSHDRVEERLGVGRAVEQHLHGARAFGAHDHELACVDVEDVNQHAVAGHDGFDRREYELGAIGDAPHEMQVVHGLEQLTYQILARTASDRGHARLGSARGAGLRRQLLARQRDHRCLRIRLGLGCG